VAGGSGQDTMRGGSGQDTLAQPAAMRRFRARGPDGKVYTVEAPDAQAAGLLLDDMVRTAGGRRPDAGMGDAGDVAFNDRAPENVAADRPDLGMAMEERIAAGYRPPANGSAEAAVPTGELRPNDPGFAENIGNRLYDAANAIGLPGARMRRDAQSLDAAVRGAADSATFGLADEIAAGAGAVTGIGGKQGDYAGNLEAQRAIDERDAALNPGARFAGQIGGAVATLPLTGSVNVVKVPAALPMTAARGARAANTIQRGAAAGANAAATGAAYGGAYGFGSAEGDPVSRALGALDGALTGGAVGALLPAITGGTKWLAQQSFGRPMASIANAIAPRQRAGAVLHRAMADDAANAGATVDDALNGIEMARARGTPLTALDTGESTRTLGRTAANLSPQGRDRLVQMVDQRRTTQADRAIDTITRNAPGVNAPQRRAQLEIEAQAANRRNYERAYRDGSRGIWHEGFQQLTVSPDMQAAIRDATRIGANEAAIRGARPPRNPFRANPDGTIDPIPDVQPTLEFWDHVKRSLDGQIGIQQRAGNKEYVSQLTRLKNQLVGYLDRAVPSYAQARRTAASFFGADDALEAGRLFVRREGDNAGSRDAIARMSEPERLLFAEGFATQLVDDLRNLPDRHTILNRIFQSPAARQRVEIALGKDGADAMESMLRLEALMDLGHRAVTGNSTGVQQLIAQGLLGGAAGATAGGGDITSPHGWIAAALTVGLARGVRAGLSRADQQMARELADLLATNDPQVIRQAFQRISSNPRGLKALRRAHTWLTRAATPLVESGRPAPVSGMAGGIPGGSEPAQADEQPR
jgi:hypothetical protein